MVLVRDFDGFADFSFHAWHGLVFGTIGESFRVRVVSAFGVHDAGAHVINPGGDEFFLHVIKAFN